MQSAEKVIAELVTNEHFQSKVTDTFNDVHFDWDEEVAKTELPRTVLIDKARQQVLALNSYVSPGEIDMEWQKTAHRIADHQTKVRQINNDGRSRRNMIRWVAGTAATLLLVLGGWYQFSQNTATSLVTYTTGIAETKEIRLPDNSLVLLNANSSLHFDKDWQNDEDVRREVTLKGEAYFEVTKTTETGKEKFSVKTASGRVTVLGTIFNVRNRKQKDLEVVLLEGKINLTTPEKETTVLLPGQRAWVNKYNQLVIEPIEDTEPYVAWKAKRLVFRDMPISRIKQRLQDEFGISLYVPDPALLDRKVSATMNDNNPYALVEAVAVLYDLQLNIDQDSSKITMTE